MTEHSVNFNSFPAVPVLLVGCNATSAKPWLQACERLNCEATMLQQASDCRSQIAAHGSACIIASTWPKIDASLLDASDHAFKRSTIILVSKDPKEVDFWQSVCWDVFFEQLAVDTAIDAIRAGVLEANKRREDCDLVDSFHQREATLTNDESLVMVSICRGLLNKKIASNHGVSIRTVEQRRRHVFDKMQIDSVAPLAALVAKVHEIERRGTRRNSPSIKKSRFWTSWDAAHSEATKIPHFNVANQKDQTENGPHSDKNTLSSYPDQQLESDRRGKDSA